MTSFDANGYDDLRSYMQNNWRHIAIVDDQGTELFRINVNTDSRASFVSGSGANPLTAEITLTGQDFMDEGISLPSTVALTEVYKTSAGTTRVAHDSVKDATVETANDEVIITHDYKIPP